MSYADFQKQYENVPDGLDLEVAKSVAAGKGWGKEDQARYDAAMAKRGEAKDRAQTYQQTSATTKPAGGGSGKSPFQSSTQTQTVNQDNDITSNVTGDNNVVSNTQDNSVRHFGGNTTNFTYNGSGDPLKDTPATAMTLAGIGSVQDSPADTAKFMNKYTTLNKDNQKGYKDFGLKTSARYVKQGQAMNPVDYQALDQRVEQRIQSHYDRAEKQSNLNTGDKYNYKPPVFKMPDTLNQLNSEVGSIADKYSDKMDDDD